MIREVAINQKSPQEGLVEIIFTLQGFILRTINLSLDYLYLYTMRPSPTALAQRIAQPFSRSRSHLVPGSSSRSVRSLSIWLTKPNQLDRPLSHPVNQLFRRHNAQDVLGQAMDLFRSGDSNVIMINPYENKTYRDGRIKTLTVAEREIALADYQAGLNRGELPTAETVLPLIKAYCLNPEQDPDVPMAMDLYGDFLRAEEKRERSTQPSVVTERAKAPACDGPSVELYDALLLGISRSPTIKNHDFAWKLLQDMKIRNVHFDTPTTLAHIQTYMSFSRTHKYAFSVYDRFYKLHPPALGASEEAYLTIVQTFLFSQYEKSLTPSPRYLFEMIHDMRRQGIEASHPIVVTALSYYAKLAYSGGLSSQRENNEKIMKDIRYHVDMLIAWCRLDPFIPMDTLLVNSMMNATCRTGGLKETYSMWLEISETEDPNLAANNASVSIMFDSIGLHSTAFAAHHLFKWLRSGSFPLTLSNYHSYLTSLLRTGWPEQALDELTIEMKRNLGSPKAPSPTWETVRILMDWQDQFGDLTKSRIRAVIEKEFPEFWVRGPGGEEGQGLKDRKGLTMWEIEMDEEERDLVDLLSPLDHEHEQDHEHELGDRETNRASNGFAHGEFEAAEEGGRFADDDPDADRDLDQSDRPHSSTEAGRRGQQEKY
ncbi:hypothetical protein [Phaffia rhodozyma]|uniref:Uncharacterized protein n=1 Tax=Phaffia rhodozyma TaxID=264483 RepID=A0A0F7SWS5_PHARH|nr:hypothetical protein [Phaffia rhodozyma]